MRSFFLGHSSGAGECAPPAGKAQAANRRAPSGSAVSTTGAVSLGRAAARRLAEEARDVDGIGAKDLVVAHGQRGHRIGYRLASSSLTMSLISSRLG